MDEILEEAEVLAQQALDEIENYTSDEVAARAKLILLEKLQPN
jgi:hypothetical protein